MSNQRSQTGSKTYQIRFPKPFTSAKQLITRRAGHDKVLCKINTPNTVEPTNKRLPLLALLLRRHNPRHHGAHKPRPEPLLVQTRADQVGHRAGTYLPLLAQAVHVDFVAHQVRHRGDVGGQAREPDVQVRAVGEDLGKVVRDGEGLEAEAEVAGDGDAVLARHREAGSAIWMVSRIQLIIATEGWSCSRCLLILKGELWGIFWSVYHVRDSAVGRLDVPWQDQVSNVASGCLVPMASDRQSF